MARDSYETKTGSMSKSKQVASSVDTNDSSSNVSFPSLVAHSSSVVQHQTGYNGMHTPTPLRTSEPTEPASDCPWNSYDNVPPTPAPAFPYDPEIEGPNYDMQVDIDYNHQEMVPGAPQRIGSVGNEALPQPLTPMGALATPPDGYEWYISPTYQAYLVPLVGTSSTLSHLNSTYGISMPLAPYGLPTPPREVDTGHRHTRISSSMRGLPEWVAANPGRDLVDILDEGCPAWTRGKASRQ